MTTSSLKRLVVADAYLNFHTTYLMTMHRPTWRQPICRGNGVAFEKFTLQVQYFEYVCGSLVMSQNIGCLRKWTDMPQFYMVP